MLARHLVMLVNMDTYMSLDTSIKTNTLVSTQSKHSVKFVLKTTGLFWLQSFLTHVIFDLKMWLKYNT
jgi:hypothetical protein